MPDNLEHYMMVAAASTGDVQTVQNKLQANSSLVCGNIRPLYQNNTVY